jgi:signal peptidase I
MRFTVQLAWLTVLLGIGALVALPHAAPLADAQMFIVRGGSMEPAIPLGAAIFVRQIDPATIQPGDVITFTAESGTVVTHRVIEVTGTNGLAFHTKGDASESADPRVTNVDNLIGRVELQIPHVGWLQAFMGTTSGAIATVSLLGGLLLAVWFIDELVVFRDASRQRRVVPEPAP